MSDYYSETYHGPYELIDIGDFVLASGKVIDKCQLAVATFGTLNDAKDNAILVPTWYAGSNKIIEQAYIGVERGLDPSKYFIIVVNQLGGGLSTSSIHRESFPQVTIVDDVNAQLKLLDEIFGISTLAMVFGASMGGQQALQWAALYPDKVKRLAAVAAVGSPTSQTRALLRSMQMGLNLDDQTHAQRALQQHALAWAALGLSADFYRTSGYQAFGEKSGDDFVDGFLTNFFAPMDTSALLCMLKKSESSMLTDSLGNTGTKALEAITAETVVMPIDSDQIFTLSDIVVEQRAIAGSQLCVLKSTHGHLALFGGDSGFLAQIDENLKTLLTDAG